MPELLVLTALAAGPNLLTSAQVRRDEGVVRSTVVRDGKATWEGDAWDTEATAIMQPKGLLEWDHGQVQPIAAAFLQADNNDDYLLWGSEDGEHFTLLWKAPPDPMPGMRTRTATNLTGSARYLRLTGEGGDQRFSIGELQVFAAAADLVPDAIPRLAAPPPPPRPEPTLDRSLIVVAVLAVLLVLYFTRRRTPAAGQPGATAVTSPPTPSLEATPDVAAASEPPAEGDDDGATKDEPEKKADAS